MYSSGHRTVVKFDFQVGHECRWFFFSIRKQILNFARLLQNFVSSLSSYCIVTEPSSLPTVSPRCRHGRAGVCQ